jgi:hypothetical protein
VLEEILFVFVSESGVSNHEHPTMILSEFGEIANHFWFEIPKHFPFVELGEFVVMPNHVIRNDGEYLHISAYIRNNPSNWLGDKFNME